MIDQPMIGGYSVAPRTKRCCKCKEDKPLSEYSPCNQEKTSYCRACANEYSKNRYRTKFAKSVRTVPV